eukprot:Gregarina_sp_Poly_1__3436@NODE_199_length_11565_cov_209_900244_g178_i0_p3_GENE_NODE_199_length_11565_cov_209_900244_g178_i0NODE_199_length_11565_cov_209_900244_g178_i0_p3_ORF_typecomplete_len609_score78_34ANAPC4_WD40/PF12894_7/40ANAPC4_WD40/PF12894_7/30ANAPC4_WD40/PF12894_7/0_00035ANAPC4_WD40/PF12894_7/0_74ANAPC4_WD40/PF12894_7/0_86WD40/PF00400_32/1_9e03WD40/PF00400_32/1_6e07WD40/PF00400_32/6_7Ge1_WD40/PF16529_5/2_9e02Ge1_WD40/PF16529_5/0_0011CPSF_A/PF03178_15/74CPSF_A/PF03178_15/0_032VID27/PF08
MPVLLDEGYENSSSDDADVQPACCPQPVQQKRIQSPVSVDEKNAKDDIPPSFQSIIREQSDLVGDDGELRLPSLCRKFKCGISYVTTIDSTFRGNRIVVGDFLGNVRIFDFYAMDLDGERYVEIKLPTNRPLESIRFSIVGIQLLISDGEKVAHVYNAAQLSHVVDTYKGDVYVRDAANTLGHTHQIFDVQWHPSSVNLFATSSLDGTVRIWDSTSAPQGLDHALANQLVLKTTNSRGSSLSQECPVYSIAFVNDKEIVGGCGDGSIQLWGVQLSSIKSRKPSKVVRNISQKPILKVGASYDKGWIHARTEDHIFLWNRNNLTAEGTKQLKIDSSDPKRPCLAYMDYGRIVITSVVDSSGNPAIRYYYADTLEEIATVNLSSELNKICSLSYNENLKQIFIGTDKGEVCCIYNEATSNGGILAVSHQTVSISAKPAHKLEGASTDESQMTYSWYELPSNIKQMKDGTLKEIKPRRYQLRAERNPQMASTGTDEPILKRTMAESVMKEFLDAESQHRGEDEQDWVEKVRRGGGLGHKLYGEVSIVDQAYKRSQPEPMLDTSDAHDAGEALLIGERKCPQCGLKMCTCGYMDIVRGRIEADKVLKKQRRL